MGTLNTFRFANGDPTGYGLHAGSYRGFLLRPLPSLTIAIDFFNGWDAGALEKAIAECTCNPFGDPTCCAEKGVFTFDQTDKCFITDAVGEQSERSLSPERPRSTRSHLIYSTRALA